MHIGHELARRISRKQHHRTLDPEDVEQIALLEKAHTASLDGACPRPPSSSCMAIERKHPYGPLDERRLHAFETGLPTSLPGEYRAFLSEFNGAAVCDAEDFAEVPGGTRVKTLFGLHDGPPHERLDDMRENFRGSAPESLLVIAADPYGDYFGLALAGLPRGTVCFIDHEQLPVDLASLTRVAPSFAALLARIGTGVAPRPVATTAEDAIAQGDAERLRVLLAEGATARGLVHRALRTGNLDVLLLVLDHGGDANERGGIGDETPLFVAARENRADMAALLLGHGADPNATCRAGGTAMEMATYWPAVLEVLARAGARPTTNRLREAVRRILGSDSG
jgi:hypothetical protein